MKSVALLMIAITFSVAAQAQEMIEVPNAPPFMPPRKPSPLEARRERGRVLRDLGSGVTVAGAGLFLGGLGYLTGTTISDLFGPHQPDPSLAPTTLGLTISGALLAGGVGSVLIVVGVRRMHGR
jgi:hypothetical protein